MPMLEKSRGAGQVQAESVAAAGKPALQSFVVVNTAPDTVVYTESTLQEGLPPFVDLTVLQKTEMLCLVMPQSTLLACQSRRLSSMENATNHIHIQLREMLS